jgi:hypothetical protein
MNDTGWGGNRGREALAFARSGFGGYWQCPVLPGPGGHSRADRRPGEASQTVVGTADRGGGRAQFARLADIARREREGRRRDLHAGPLP